MPDNFVVSKNSKQLYEVNIKNILASLNDAYVFWKDKKSNFLGCNKNFLASTGCGSSQDFIKTNDYDMPWANAFADISSKEVIANIGLTKRQSQCL